MIPIGPTSILDGKSWAPHIACVIFAGLCHWINGNRKTMLYGISLVWQKPTNYLDDYYFCKIVSFIIKIREPS